MEGGKGEDSLVASENVFVVINIILVLGIQYCTLNRLTHLGHYFTELTLFVICSLTSLLPMVSPLPMVLHNGGREGEESLVASENVFVVIINIIF